GSFSYKSKPNYSGTDTFQYEITTTSVINGVTEVLTDTAWVTIIYDTTPSLAINKEAQEDSFKAVGDVIPYEITLTNTGNITLTGVSLSDSLISSLTLTPNVSTLDPGESITATGSYTITQADLDRGYVLNTATASSNETDDITDDARVDAERDPGLSVEKKVKKTGTSDAFADAISIDQTTLVTFQVTVSNTGNLTLNSLKVSDNLIPSGTPVTVEPGGPATFSNDGSGHGQLLLANPLAPNQSVVLTYTQEITFDESATTELTNTATASGIPAGDETPITDSDTAKVRMPKVNITVIKNWEDASDEDGLRPDEIWVQLKSNGTPLDDSVKLHAGNSWSHTWSNKPKNSNGSAITYTAQEVEVPDGYDVSYPDPQQIDGQISLTIRNIHQAGTVEISAEKRWEDFGNRFDTRPAYIMVQLLKDGHAEGDAVKLDNSNNWSHTWAPQIRYDGTREIAYSIQEIEAPTHYAASEPQSEDGHHFVITNTLDKFKIQLIKRDGCDKQTRLEGASFELRAADASSGGWQPGQLLENLTSDSQGQVQTNNFYAP
ncbi:MAG: Cna B-type domain-containing protein, partial [Actinobacteria bacterium]|nr:Cna B-type domain-containing protein [Actinomycetota bacterium]